MPYNATLSKKRPRDSVSCYVFKIFKDTFLKEHMLIVAGEWFTKMSNDVFQVKLLSCAIYVFKKGKILHIDYDLYWSWKICFFSRGRHPQTLTAQICKIKFCEYTFISEVGYFHEKNRHIQESLQWISPNTQTGDECSKLAKETD